MEWSLDSLIAMNSVLELWYNIYHLKKNLKKRSKTLMNFLMRMKSCSKVSFEHNIIKIMTTHIFIAKNLSNRYEVKI
jgi:hypothetical protein